MRKSLFIVGMLSIGYAHAQQGNVGINTDKPKATLEINPNTTNADIRAKTNEGILAPRLTKTRVANISSPVQGTLVYVLDEDTTEHPASLISAYTGNDTKVAKITEKGYYFYNGTEWVKAGANGGTSSNIYTDNGTINEERIIQATNLVLFDFGLAKQANAKNLFVVDNGDLIVDRGRLEAVEIFSKIDVIANADVIAKDNLVSHNLIGTGTRNVVATSNGVLTIGTATTPLRTETESTTLRESDNGGYVYVDSATAVDVTVPDTLPAGFSCVLVQQGDGQVTIVNGTGVTLQTARGTKTRTKYSAIGIIKRTAAEATITGDATN